MHCQFDATQHGLEAKLTTAGTDAAGRPTYALRLLEPGEASTLQIVAHGEGLYCLAAAILWRLEQIEGLSAVGGGLVSELGPTDARALAHALIGAAYERERTAAGVVAR